MQEGTHYHSLKEDLLFHRKKGKSCISREGKGIGTSRLGRYGGGRKIGASILLGTRQHESKKKTLLIAIPLRKKGMNASYSTGGYFTSKKEKNEDESR